MNDDLPGASPVDQLVRPVAEALHVAVCQAVALLNVAPEVARCREGREARDILRQALADYADAYMDQPAPEQDRATIARKHRNARFVYCWLVEEFKPDGSSTGRYMLCQGALTITADVHAARRLRLQQSAGFRALDMRAQHGGDWRPVEHGFEA